jgi:hydrogenase maturation factor
MCLTTVATVIGVEEGMALLDLGGRLRRASTAMEPDIRPGDLVLVGLGAVLGRVEPADLDRLKALDQGHHQAGDIR